MTAVAKMAIEIADNFPRHAMFVWIAARLNGESYTLKYARAKSWIALSCIDADLAFHMLQRDDQTHTMLKTVFVLLTS